MADENQVDACTKLLAHYERMRHEEDTRDAAELLGLLGLIFVLLLCAVMSVAIDIAAALTTVPPLGVLCIRKRHHLLALVKGVRSDEHVDR